MTLWWIVDIVLLLVVVPVVVYLLNGVLDEAREHRAERHADRAPRPRRARRTSTPSRCCSPRRTRSCETVENVADYGGSLDVIVDDARRLMPAAGVAPDHHGRR